MSTESKYLENEGGNIPDEKTYIKQYGDNKYGYSTHYFLTNLAEPTLLDNGLQLIKNKGDGHCFYHAVLRYTINTAINGIRNRCLESQNYYLNGWNLKIGTYGQDIKIHCITNMCNLW